MKSLHYVQNTNRHINPELIEAVYEDIGEEYIEDVCHYGIDKGFGNFIYYSDTSSFFRKWKKPIVKMLEDLADELGVSAIDLVANFECIKDNSLSTKRTIAETIYSTEYEDSEQIENALAWFAAEEVCRMFED